MYSSKCVFFKEKKSYALDKDISVEMVYSQLRKLQSAEANFQWNESIDKCWILSNMDGSAIYYAAPQSEKYNKCIPNKNEWISVHGSLPLPEIYANLLETGNAPSDDDK